MYKNYYCEIVRPPGLRGTGTGEPWLIRQCHWGLCHRPQDRKGGMARDRKWGNEKKGGRGGKSRGTK